MHRGRVVPVRDLRDRVLVHARGPDDLPALAAEGPLPDTGSAALAALRGAPDVVVAGPLAVHDPEGQGPMGLNDEIDLVLADGATLELHALPEIEGATTVSFGLEGR